MSAARPGRFFAARALPGIVGTPTLMLVAAGCGNGDAAPPVSTEVGAPGPGNADAPESTLLPSRIPISAVMSGVVNRASFEIFQAATDAGDLSDDDWLRIGSAAIDLVGASTLVTIPGTGPMDESWVAEPQWLQLSTDMQDASLDIGRAASTRDGRLLSEATARLAQSCQSCHLVFSRRLVTSPPSPN